MGGPVVSTPRSWVVFLVGTALAMGIFAPLALAGWHLEEIPLFLAGTGAFALASLLAAFMGLRFTASLAAGRYRVVEPRQWGDQIW